MMPMAVSTNDAIADGCLEMSSDQDCFQSDDAVSSTEWLSQPSTDDAEVSNDTTNAGAHTDEILGQGDMIVRSKLSADSFGGVLGIDGLLPEEQVTIPCDRCHEHVAMCDWGMHADMHLKEVDAQPSVGFAEATKKQYRRNHA